MSIPVLETKLHVPGSPRGVVQRSRLSDHIERGVCSKLTLVSAPPGFGKTTLVGDWLAGHAARVTAWLSLDATDSDRATFWTYVVAALQPAVAAIGGEAKAALESAPPAVDAGIHALLNDLAAVATDVILVLDDFHVIDSPKIADDLSYFLDHMPAQVHVVIISRSDPLLPLPRMRARGQVVEIRAADLRFTDDEAAQFLNGSMELHLKPDEVDALEGKTEGWIAALQLAALSLRGRRDAKSFIADFTGDDRYVVDYLADEVLARQSDKVRRFLLDTSILDRLTGPLCDALTGGNDGTQMLEALDRANLFLIALDDQRRWFRYHHLFADVLRSRLQGDRPDAKASLHNRASEWFEQQGELPEAISHALAAHDFERAAELVELAHPALGRARAETTLRGWLDALPLDLFENRPILAAAYAGALMQTGEFNRVDRLITWAEESLSGNEDERVVVARDLLPYLPGQLEMYHAALARIGGDLAGTMAHARRALELADPSDHLGRGGPAALLGLASWESGDLDAGYEWFEQGMVSLDAGGFHSDVVGGAVTLADIRIAQARLNDAMRIYERGLQVAMSQTGKPLRGAADMHTGLSAVLLERNELASAARHLATARDLGEDNGLPKNPGRWRITAARLRQVEGDLDGALELLDDAQAHFFSDMSPDVQPIGALKARLWITQGRLSLAWEWARERRLAPDDEHSYVRHFEHATLARLMLAHAIRDEPAQALSAATEYAARLVESALGAEWLGAAIDAMVVHALARHAQGDAVGAVDTLKRSIAIAEPGGYFRLFLDEGEPMTELLREAAKGQPSGSYVLRLRAATTTVAQPSAGEQPLVEPLSERELEILRLLATELSGPEIASHLVVSLNTVRTHTKNVFRSLASTRAVPLSNERRSSVS